ncbi:IS110 family transposase [Flavisolibacter sp. BT320]|nr:IS110 family transposase [Flavisolibacter longurius]
MVQHTKTFLGIDVSKPHFDVSVVKVVNHQKQPMLTERFSNTAAGLKAFHKWLVSLKVNFNEYSLLVIENTGMYHRLLWKYCSEHGLPIHIGNAAHIKWSFGIARGKNDKVDSQRLCSYALKHADELKATPVLDPVFLKLKDLLASRSKLLTQLNGILTYLKELKLSNPASVQTLMEKAHKAAIEGLKKSILEIEKQLKQLVQEDERIRRNYQLLVSVPGVGHVTALHIIRCTNNFALKVSGKQLGSYAGVVPFQHTSGISIKGRNRVHSMANKELKCMLHLCALIAVRYYPEFKHYYERKRAEGKHTMSVLNAVRNKIALRVVAVVNKQQPYVAPLSTAI